MLLEHNVNVYNELEQTLANNNCCCVVMGTGVGKTYVATEYLENHDFKALVVSPRQSINKSWEKHTKRVEAITYQKLANIYKDIDYTKYNILICDEVHHIGAPKWGKPIKYLIDNKIIKVIGLTESSVRYTDGGRDVADEFFGGNVAFGESVPSAIKKQILNPVTYVGAMYNSDGLKKTLRGKIQSRLYAKLNLALNKTPTVQEIIKKNMPSGKRKGIIFASTIDDIKFAIDFIKNIYPNVEIKCVHSKQSDVINNKNIEWFKKINEGYLCSVDMISEGIHIKGVNTLIMLRRTESVNLFNQQLGRCLDASSKEPAILFDLVNNKYSIRIVKNKLRIRTNSLFENSKINVVPSEQLIVNDYTKDIIDVLKEIRDSLYGRWTKEEDDIIIDYYTNHYSWRVIKDIQKLLPERNTDSINHRAKELGVKKDWNPDSLSQEEIAFLKEMGEKGATRKEMLTKFHEKFPNHEMTWAKFANNCKRYSISYSKQRNYITKEELEILKKYYPIEGLKSAKRVPWLTISTIRHVANRYGLKSNKYQNRDKKVICVETGDIYDSINEVVRKNNTRLKEGKRPNTTAIRKAIKENSLYHGYHWKFVE